jgi:hypothetical protein
MQLIVGLKGTGKTKALIDEVNRASRESDGVVICVEYGRKLTFDIKYHARLVDAKEYGINDAQKLYGFLCGMLACNYDITDLFIDSALKICGGDIKAFEELLAAADRITADHNINCVITASVEAESLSEQARAFVRGI